MFTKRIFTLLGLLALATSLHAQDFLRVNVPFDFRVGRGQPLPTGTYQISHLDPFNPAILLVRNLNGQSRMSLIKAKSDDKPGTGKLVFRRYGETYFLVGIVTHGTRYDLATSRDERHLAQHASVSNELNVQGQ